MTPPRSSSFLSADVSARRDALRRQLDTLVQRGDRRLLRHAVSAWARTALSWSPLALVAGPLAALVWQAGRLVAGEPPAAFDLPAIVALALAGPVALVAVVIIGAALSHRRNRAAALALFDRELGPGDRLRTTDEFLHSELLDAAELEASFMRAAIEAHTETVARALANRPAEIPSAAPAFSLHSLWGLPAAAALILLLVNWSDVDVQPGEPSRDQRSLPQVAGTTSTLSEIPQRKSRPPTVAQGTPPTPSPAAPAPQRSATQRSAKNDDQQSSEQSSGHGSQSNASDAAANAASQATPQKPAQSQPETRKSKPAELSKPEARRTPPKPRQTDTAQLAAQADSGHGRSPSSSNNPPSPFDQPEAPDRAGALPDRDVEAEGQEDEDEQQKADQASQPMRNQPVADVDRNLSPMSTPPVESEDPPNGRGGPGDIKKSRGVPSMILGIPVPDRVPGIPGAGRTKITQEFARPTPESHPAITAEIHAPRSGAVGVVQQPELLPWRRQLLERYFKYPRPSDSSKTTDETSTR